MSLSVSESLTIKKQVLIKKVQVRILAGVCYRYKISHSKVVKHILLLDGNKSFIITEDITQSEITWSLHAAIIRTRSKFLKIEDNFLY